ncbi:MAG: hypothetical protein KF833_07785 [Verrucomicrobiae bacterium]|nr:hypothetical protein [Verrucomicrobiae bacterium]
MPPSGIRTLALSSLLALLVLRPATAVADAVHLQLRIPEAVTHVIGDPIPLLWRFENRGPDPLGFMWEGCCRLNGQLVARAAEGTLPATPPVQALAHMFARADRLDPGTPKEYDTLVSDWVVLRASGTYSLQGTYRGVLPTQSPIVPRGLGLWRDQAVSQPISLTVLDVPDYLAQRDAQAAARGIRLIARGPDRLHPLQPATLHLRFENTGPSPQSFLWPVDNALWVLNDRDERVAPMAVPLGSVSPVTLPPGGHTDFEFSLAADRFEDQPLGRYRWFIDLPAAGPGQPRVPSNLVPLTWQLGPPEVEQLLVAAARGAGTGARNAPLRLLRIYLADIGPKLAQLDLSTLEPDVATLAQRLSQAAQLKPIAPHPGAVDLILAVPPSGPVRWTDPRIATVAAAGGPSLAAQAGLLVHLRRHLGWELRLALEPGSATPLGQLRAVARAVEPLARDWAAPPAVPLPTGSTNEPARLTFPDPATSALLPILRLRPGQAEWSDDGLAFRPWTPPADPATDPTASRPSGPPPRIRILSPPALPWHQLLATLRPLLEPAAHFEWTPDPGPTAPR